MATTKTYGVWLDAGMRVTVPAGVDPETPEGYAALRAAYRERLLAVLAGGFGIDWYGPYEDGQLGPEWAEGTGPVS